MKFREQETTLSTPRVRPLLSPFHDSFRFVSQLNETKRGRKVGSSARGQRIISIHETSSIPNCFLPQTMKCGDLLDFEENVCSECLLVNEHRLRLLPFGSKFHTLNAHSLNNKSTQKNLRKMNTKREETIENTTKQDQTSIARFSKSEWQKEIQKRFSRKRKDRAKIRGKGAHVCRKQKTS